MSLVSHLRCVCCDQKYPPRKAGFTCPACGPVEGMFDVCYDMDAVAEQLTLSDLLNAPLSQWRYGPLLPLETRHAGRDWPIGWTPLTESASLASQIGVKRLRIKDEGRNFSGSLKDRGSSVALVRAVDGGAAGVACASHGNAAGSIAACGALAGMPAYVFVPQGTASGRVTQILAYGAKVFLVAGTYDDARALCARACQRFNWYNATVAYNPYIAEGAKTLGMELAEQCFADPPDWVAVPVGEGSSIAATWKGLDQLRQLEIIDWRVRLLGVQAGGVAPIAAAFHKSELTEVSGTTVADSICVRAPLDWRKAVSAVRESEGTFITVTDTQILEAVRQMGSRAGVFAEPAAAAAVAGIAQAVRNGIVDRRSSVLAVCTATGLKDVAGAQAGLGSALRVAADLDAIEPLIVGG